MLAVQDVLAGLAKSYLFEDLTRDDLAPPDAPAAEIAAALSGLLNDQTALREARRFAGVIAGLGGGATATEQIVRLTDA